MTRDHTAEANVLADAAAVIEAHPEWKPVHVLQFLNSYAKTLREHTHEPA